MSDRLHLALSAADAVLVSAARAFVRSSGEPEFASELAAVSDWPALLERAEEHGMTGVLARAAAPHIGSMPARIATRLCREARASALLALHRGAEVAEVLRALTARGVEPIVLKGVSLGATLYPDPGLRPFRDLDLLVAESQWPEVRAALLGLEAEPIGLDSEHLPARLVESDALDHWVEYQLPTGLRVECGFDALQLGVRMRDAEGLRQRSEPLGLPGTRAGARSLAAEDALVALCVHLNRHGFGRLLWLLDIGLLVERHPGLDWRAVGERSRQEGVETAVHQALALAGELLGVAVDEGLAHTRPSPLRLAVWRRTWDEDSLAAFEGEHEGPLVFRKTRGQLSRIGWVASLGSNVLLTGRSAEKAAYFARKLVPTKEFLAIRYARDDSPGARREGYLTLWTRRLTLAIGASAARTSGSMGATNGARGRTIGTAVATDDVSSAATDAASDSGHHRRTFKRAVGWNAVAKLSTRFIQFFVTVVLARLLLPADFGLAGMTMIVTGLLSMLAEFGFAYALIQKREISEDDISTAFTTSVLLGSAATVVAFLAAPLIGMLFRDAAMVAPMRGMAFGMFVVSFAITPRALLYRRMDFRSTALADLTGSIVYGTVSIALALAGFGVWSLVAGSLLMSASQAGVLAVRAAHRFRLYLSRQSLRELFPFGSRVLAANMVDYLRGNLDYFIVGRALGPAALGFYTIAFRTADFPRSRLAAIVGDVALPAMSSVQERADELKATYGRSVRMSASFTVPVLVGVTALAPEFVSAVYGVKWLSAVPALQLLLPMGVLMIVCQSGTNVLIATGEPGRLLWLSVSYAIAVGVASAVGVAWGITGVALGVLIATIGYFAAFQITLAVRAGIGLSDTLRQLAIPALGSVAMVALLLAYRRLVPFADGMLGLVWLAGAAAVGGAGYVLVAWPLVGSARRRERSAAAEERSPDVAEENSAAVAVAGQANTG